MSNVFMKKWGLFMIICAKEIFLGILLWSGSYLDPTGTSSRVIAIWKPLYQRKRGLTMIIHMAIGRRNQCFLIIVFVLTGLTFYYFGIREEAIQKSKMRLLKEVETAYPRGFLVHTPGCRIPEMDPYDVSVRKYVKQNYFPICNEILPLVESNQTSLWIITEVLRNYNVSDSSELVCCYSEFWREPASNGKIKDLDNKVQMSKDCISFNNSANIPYEFVKVECEANGALIYQDFHAFIVPKSKKDKETTQQKLQESSDESNISVLVIGADSLSRLNFHRKMPKTKNFINYLGGIEFFGYNKVQDNTFPNLVPLLSGYSVEELTFCWPNHSSYFDDCPWIWKNFSSNNYVTAFGEDACWMGIFNYNKEGFREPPTDYYARPLIHTSEKLIGRNKILNAKFCIGHRYAPEVLLNYAYKFSVNMTLLNKKFWGLFWESSLTHDFLNGPSQTDDIFYDFFEKLQKDNVLNNTAVLFLSDHGMRWGSIRTTYQGRMEEHLPFLFVLLPDWFKGRYSTAVKNLQRNTHLLTTHFDVHETMKDFMDLNFLKPENLESRALEATDKRAFSLFLPGSAERTCESAGIKPTWCTCQHKREVLTTDNLVQKAAKITVDYLNAMLKSYKECAQLELEEIISAHIESEGEQLRPTDFTNSVSDYVITFVTTPGLAKFESVVRHRSDTGEMTVVADISRINLYGSQSKCISDYRLKLYCYCI